MQVHMHTRVAGQINRATEILCFICVQLRSLIVRHFDGDGRDAPSRRRTLKQIRSHIRFRTAPCVLDTSMRVMLCACVCAAAYLSANANTLQNSQSYIIVYNTRRPQSHARSHEANVHSHVSILAHIRFYLHRYVYMF